MFPLDQIGMSQCTRCVCPLGADEKVKENERVEALRERAQIIVELERTQPGSHQYHKYMHIVRTTDASNNTRQLEWEGIAGRVKQLLDERVKHLAELQDERTEQVLRSVERLDAKLVAMDKRLSSG